MKAILPIVFALTFTVSTFAEETTAKSAPAPAATTNKAAPRVVATVQVSAATITAPMVLTNGHTEIVEGVESVGSGKAIFNFSVTNAGTYVITAMINAPGEDQNSFFLNVDAVPDDTMIWDMEPTDGFQERTVSWRGNGDANNDEISPKKFTLSAGAHKLYIAGREGGTQLKSISICASN